jgi:hypothetical protein
MKTREELQAALDDLRRERGSATLAGRAFDSDQIAAIQAQLDAIQDAEAEAARRQRAENEGGKARLGPLAFSPGVEKADVKWWEVDAATFAKHLNPIIGEETNGKS